ncbi:MAG: sulfotransferase [Bacteroidota bacterium]
MDSVKRAISGFLEEHPSVSEAVLSVLRPREFQLYNIGAAKTGTTSIAGLFGRFRRGHERRIYESAVQIAARWDGYLSDDELAAWLHERDRRLWLECDSCQTLAWFSDILAREFPEARFMLTVRDCYSWLRSIVDHHANKPALSDAQIALRKRFYGTHSGDAASAPLREAGLYCIEGYLSYWVRHNTFVLDSLPDSRLLVLPTQRISGSEAAIAAHVGIDASRLKSDRSHRNPRLKKRHILEEVPREAVAEKIDALCRPTIDRLQALPALRGYDAAGV